MKIWNKSFKVWSDTCPHVRRELFTKDAFVKWARDLNLVGALEEDDFHVFLEILEDCEIICPIAFIEETKFDKSELGAILITFPIYRKEQLVEKQDNTELTPCYHPIQFFDIIRWYRHKSLVHPPYHISKKYGEYYSYKKLEFQLDKRKKEFKYLEDQEPAIAAKDKEIYQEYSKKLQEKLDTHPLNDRECPVGKELLKYFEIGWTRNVLTEEYLIIWIKIESLLLQDDAHIFARHPPNMWLNVEDLYLRANEEEYKREIEKYKEWREKIIEEDTYLSGDEREILMKFHRELDQTHISDGDFGVFGISGNWNDLLDIIPPEKKDRLRGMTSYFVNLLSMKRYIERVYWELFKKSISSGKETSFKPYFIIDSPEDYRKYSQSVLLDFGLTLSNPFVLYVEGATERTILEDYVKDHLVVRFRIVNIHGEANLANHIRINRDTKDWIFYYFLDFDNRERYLKKKEETTGMNGCFYFPDFVTENFTVDQFINALREWLSDLEIVMSPDHEKGLISALSNEKKMSEEIVGEVESNTEIKDRKTKGFEKLAINLLKRYYQEEMVNAYPDHLFLDYNGHITGDREFGDIFKTQIAARLKIYVLESIKNDTKRNLMFPFEKKLKPFMKSIMDAWNHIPHYLS